MRRSIWLVGGVVAAGCGGNGLGGAGAPADAPAGSGSEIADAAPGGHADARPTGGGVDAAPSAGDLTFAIVGDTRPANEDDTAHYPTDIITTIWTDVEHATPHPQFAISTGDYMFASTGGTQQDPQLDLYLAARAHYGGTVYAAMGNHECTGFTASNCGSGNADGLTTNYQRFMARMVAPLGESEPYYVERVNDPNGQWTAKIVVIAANAWSSAQASWLDTTLAEPTTYTFVVRHEGVDATTAPGVTPSGTIIAKHPLTLLIVGHTHTYRHYASDKEVICGNGGAPLTSGANYGYGIVDRRADGAIVFTEHDYQTDAVVESWAVHADGSRAY
jgi:hypothetical protein